MTSASVTTGVTWCPGRWVSGLLIGVLLGVAVGEMSGIGRSAGPSFKNVAFDRECEAACPNHSATAGICALVYGSGRSHLVFLAVAIAVAK